MGGWLSNASMPSIPVNMPSMPAMPSMPSIPGLRKTTNAADGGEGGVANDGLATSPDKDHQHIEAGGSAERGEDEDRSRYIRYGPLCIR